VSGLIPRRVNVTELMQDAPPAWEDQLGKSGGNRAPVSIPTWWSPSSSFTPPVRCEPGIASQRASDAAGCCNYAAPGSSPGIRKTAPTHEFHFRHGY